MFLFSLLCILFLTLHFNSYFFPLFFILYNFSFLLFFFFLPSPRCEEGLLWFSQQSARPIQLFGHPRLCWDTQLRGFDAGSRAFLTEALFWGGATWRVHAPQSERSGKAHQMWWDSGRGVLGMNMWIPRLISPEKVVLFCFVFADTSRTHESSHWTIYKLLLISCLNEKVFVELKSMKRLMYEIVTVGNIVHHLFWSCTVYDDGWEILWAGTYLLHYEPHTHPHPGSQIRPV